MVIYNINDLECSKCEKFLHLNHYYFFLVSITSTAFHFSAVTSRQKHQLLSLLKYVADCPNLLSVWNVVVSSKSLHLESFRVNTLYLLPDAKRLDQGFLALSISYCSSQQTLLCPIHQRLCCVGRHCRSKFVTRKKGEKTWCIFGVFFLLLSSIVA